MNNRISKQVKLTNTESQALGDLFEQSGLPYQREFVERILAEFFARYREGQSATGILLKPAKSAKYKTIWMSENALAEIKDFASSFDTSDNSVIYTALKKYLTANER